MSDGRFSGLLKSAAVFLLLLSAVSAQACPGCGMPTLHPMFVEPHCRIWERVIVAGAFLLLLAPFAFGWRLERTEKQMPRRRRVLLAAVMTLVWLICFMMHAVTFGTVLCNWIFFPLYIITFFGMTLAFFCQWLAWVVLPVFFLVIPFFYCYGLCTLLGRYRLVRRRRNEEES